MRHIPEPLNLVKDLKEKERRERNKKEFVAERKNAYFRAEAGWTDTDENLMLHQGIEKVIAHNRFMNLCALRKFSASRSILALRLVTL